MALTPATYTVTIGEGYTQEGQTRNSSLVGTIPSIEYTDERTVLAPSAAEISLLDFAAAGTAVGPGKVLAAKVRHLRITNQDSTNFVRIGFKKTGAATYWVVVMPTMSLVLSDLRMDANAAGGAFAALVYPDTMLVKADTADCEISIKVVQAT